MSGSVSIGRSGCLSLVFWTKSILNGILGDGAKRTSVSGFGKKLPGWRKFKLRH